MEGALLNNFEWFLAGVAITGFLCWWHWWSLRDYYVVETVVIAADVGGKLSDIRGISGGVPGISSMYDLTPHRGGYTVRRKGQQQVFGSKTFAIFDDYAAAKANFDCTNSLFLSGYDQRAAHTVFLWAVTARNRRAVSSVLLKAGGNPRKLAETNSRNTAGA